MEKTKIIIHKKFQKGKISPEIYGSFVEHMGRVVYSGIYEPSHQTADADGFREDVRAAVKEMGVTAVRYPGGNFVSNYDWRDGVGPREKRPRKVDLAWKSIETNEVGTDEFMKWAKKTGIDPIFAVNLGTGGVKEAVSLLEYCNFPGGTYYSDLRRENGRETPYGIKTWCLGNEMDGDWQIGHKTADEYGRLSYEAGKAMKLLDPSIKLAVCGSSLSSNATFGEWERIVMQHTYGCADYISLHQYYGGQEKGTAAFLAQSMDMERYIRTVCGICDAVGVQRHSSKKIDICFDEWGVWEIPDKEVQAAVENAPWQIAPSFSEQIYTMEDALLFASMMMNFLRCSDRVKIACQSLLTNISACIMTERGGDVWVQPIYYPFALMAKYGRGVVLDERSEGPSYASGEFAQVPVIDKVAVWNENAGEVVLFLVNRSEEAAETEIDLQGFEAEMILESTVLHHEDKKAANQIQHDRVVPKTCENVSLKDGKVTCELLPLSFEMVRVKGK